MDRLETWQWLALGMALENPKLREKLAGLPRRGFPPELRELLSCLQERQRFVEALEKILGIKVKDKEKPGEALWSTLTGTMSLQQQRHLALEMAERSALFSKEELREWLKKQGEKLE